MSAKDILAREAETVLLDGHFVEARADHFGPWWRVYGKLSNGDEHVGTTHLQADPQDPRDLARRLVGIASRRMPVVEAQPVAAPVMEEAHAEPVRSEPEPAAVADGGLSADAGQREVGDGPAGDAVSAGDARSGDDAAPDDDGGELGDEPGESSLAVSGVEDFDLGVFSVEAPPTDAEFVEEHLETTLIDEGPFELEGPVDLGENGPDVLSLEEQIEPELILIENDPDDIAVEEPVQRGGEPGSPGGVAYFGDRIDTIRLAKMGRLMEIAVALKDTLQEGWTTEQFSEAQGYVMHNTDESGAFVGERDKYSNFIVLSERRNAMNRVDAFMTERQRELSSLERDDILSFDPEWGWQE